MKTLYRSMMRMEQEVVDSEQAIFACSLDDGTSLGTLILPRDKWDDFGSPVELVVDVEPVE